MSYLNWSVWLLYLCQIQTLCNTQDQLSQNFNNKNKVIEDLSKWGTKKNLEVTRTSHPQDGLPLVLGCTIQQSWETCLWITPTGQDLTVKNGHFLDETGKPIDWVEVWTGDDPDNTCGIWIFAKTNEHSGDWKCLLEDSSKFTIKGILTTEEEATTNLRLPKEIIPLRYKLFLFPDLLATGDDVPFSGNITMDLKVQSEMKYIKFHAEELYIKDMSLKKHPRKERIKDNIMIRGIGFDYWRTFVYVYSDALLKGNYKLDISYESIRKDPLSLDQIFGSTHGLYKVPCETGKKKFCWFTNFLSIYARLAFPCLDEPGLKAPFDITVRGREGWKTLSNMPLQETISIGGGEFLDRFATSAPMSPYLVALSISDFVGVQADSHNMTIWAPKREIDAGNAEFARKIGAQLMDFFESYFNVPYSLPKIDMVSVPEFGVGGMENWGLVMFNPGGLLISPQDTDIKHRMGITNLVAHELTHQWLGNLVTCSWWSQVWLDEGFAVFFGYIGQEQFYPQINIDGLFLLFTVDKAMGFDADYDQTVSLSSEIKSKKETLMKINISYQKGASFIRMMRAILTKPSFARGLTAYLKKMSFRSATEDDLFFHLESVAKEDGKWPVGKFCRDSFTEAMKNWTNQKGVPLVTVVRDWNNSGKTATLNQTIYSKTGHPKNTKFDIPISYTFAGGSSADFETTTPRVWLTKEMDQVTIDDVSPDHPLVVNIQATGYYRVNYDDKNWRMIGDMLENNHKNIHVVNRVQIICDVSALSSNGYISKEIKEHVLMYIVKEDDLIAKQAIFTCSNGVDMDSELIRDWKTDSLPLTSLLNI